MWTDLPIRFLPWDSEFFGQRIARFDDVRLDPPRAAAVDSWCARERIDCLYFLADPSDQGTPPCAAGAGFTLVDVRITLDLPVNAPPPPPSQAGGPIAIRTACERDISALREMAYSNHRDSRFYFDGGFGKERCDELYATWIEKSCRGWADTVLIATSGPDPAGYISCHLREGTGQIGLLGVAARHAGCGVGQHLIEAANRWFTPHSASRIEVVTQGRNIAAQRLYQKCGFRTSDLGLWFHKRYNSEERGTGP